MAPLTRLPAQEEDSKLDSYYKTLLDSHRQKLLEIRESLEQNMGDNSNIGLDSAIRQEEEADSDAETPEERTPPRKLSEVDASTTSNATSTRTRRKRGDRKGAQANQAESAYSSDILNDWR